MISTVLHEMESFTFATALDLSMGISGAPDIFQAKMSRLMQTLEYVRTYINDLLIISSSTFEDYLNKE